MKAGPQLNEFLLPVETRNIAIQQFNLKLAGKTGRRIVCVDRSDAERSHAAHFGIYEMCAEQLQQLAISKTRLLQEYRNSLEHLIPITLQRWRLRIRMIVN